jgi:hypothetical protein
MSIRDHHSVSLFETIDRFCLRHVSGGAGQQQQPQPQPQPQQRGFWDSVWHHTKKTIDTIVPDSVNVGPFGWNVPDPFGTGGYNR